MDNSTEADPGEETAAPPPQYGSPIGSYCEATTFVVMGYSGRNFCPAK